MHEIPNVDRLIMWGLAGLAGVAALGAAASPFLTDTDFGLLYLAYAGFLGTAYLGLWGWRKGGRMRLRVVTGPDGLTAHDWRGQVTEIAWTDIRRLRQRPLLQRLDLELRSGGRLLLPYRLSGFGRLSRVVRQQIQLGLPRHYEFSAAGSRWIALALVPAVLVGSAVVFGGVLILAWLMAALFLAGWLSQWSRIRVQPGAVLVHRPFRTRRVAYDEIRDVEIVMTDAGNSRVRPSVSLHLQSDETLVFSGIREGELELSEAIDRYRDTESATGPQVVRDTDLESP